MHILNYHVITIGREFVRDATAEEAAKGWLIMIDENAFERFIMVIFAMHYPSAVCEGFGSKTPPDQERILTEMGYAVLYSLFSCVS